MMSLSKEPTVTILCSGAALGVYIPALLLNHQLRALGLKTEVEVLEVLYSTASLEKLQRHKQAFHENFALANMTHRMTGNVEASFDEQHLESLLTGWESDNRRDFIVWSGFWMPVVAQYRKRVAPAHLNVDICRIDAEISTSFKGQPKGNAREIWFWNWSQRRLEYELPVDHLPPKSYAHRERRFVVHGGGWGIGNYRDTLCELEQLDVQLDTVAYRVEEALPFEYGRRYHMVDPDWTPWIKGESDEYQFPPFGELNKQPIFTHRESHHELYELIRKAQAIVSKPGGGTLIDSLASATPVLLLEPYGHAEQRNADLWEHLGYGIRYTRWKELGFDPNVLEKLHENLIRTQRQTISYPVAYAERFRR